MAELIRENARLVLVARWECLDAGT
jgi:hypothetical protein